MKSISNIPCKIFNETELLHEINRWRLKSKKIVFTNGVFDILHQGHIASLSEAAVYGDILIVGLNADVSVKRLKGETRPVNNERSRALTLAFRELPFRKTFVLVKVTDDLFLSAWSRTRIL